MDARAVSPERPRPERAVSPERSQPTPPHPPTPLPRPLPSLPGSQQQALCSSEVPRLLCREGAVSPFPVAPAPPRGRSTARLRAAWHGGTQTPTHPHPPAPTRGIRAGPWQVSAGMKPALLCSSHICTPCAVQTPRRNQNLGTRDVSSAHVGSRCSALELTAFA